ncbi:MAG: hypothetical protein Q8P41_01415 [Pseudomonadota bacterium]|nr:hypothetical protein [Pseudomonadota bacterium]
MLLLLLACNNEPSLVHFEDGHYLLGAEDTGDSGGASVTAVLSRMDNTFVLSDGTEEITFTLSDWDEADWPTGCPTQAPAMAMEAASLIPAGFDLGGLHYTDAAVYALCPSGSRLGLAEAADIRGKDEGEKCEMGTCVFFDP